MHNIVGKLLEHKYMTLYIYIYIPNEIRCLCESQGIKNIVPPDSTHTDGHMQLEDVVYTHCRVIEFVNYLLPFLDRHGPI